MDVTTWEEPGGRRDNSGTARVVSDTLKQNKLQWAIIEELDVPEDTEAAKRLRAQASNRASLIKQGRLLPFKPRGTFEAVSRSVNLDSEGNTVTDGLITTVASTSQAVEGGAPIGEIRKLVRVFARFLGEEHAQPDPPKAPKAAKNETVAETPPVEQLSGEAAQASAEAAQLAEQPTSSAGTSQPGPTEAEAVPTQV